MKIKKIACLLLCVLLLSSLLLSCKDPADPSIIEPKTQATSYYEYFNTVSVIMSYRGDSKQEYNENCQAVDALLRDYHRMFDIYYEYAGINNLKTVNQNAGVAPVQVDERLIDFLLYAKEVYTMTAGAVNIAMGAVLSLWHDAREDGVDDPESAALPSQDALAEAAKHTDIDQLIIDKEAGTVYLADPDMRLDVGAVGKGYATEQAAQLLLSRGVTSYVLNIGGNIRAIGEKVTGEGWITGITNPDKTSANSFVCRVSIKDTSLVTSGDYERYYVVDGKKYHHIIDPKTLMPATYFSAVSIFTKDSGLADSLSTALFCLSYEDGRTLIESIGGIEVIWVYPDGKVVMTDGITLVDG